MEDNNKNNHVKEEKIEFYFERHKVFSSFNKDPRTEHEQGKRIILFRQYIASRVTVKN